MPFSYAGNATFAATTITWTGNLSFGGATDLIGFFGATRIVQPVGASQAAVVTTVGAAVDATAATNVAPYGFSQTQADDLVARVNQLRVDVLALTTLSNAERLALVNLGLIKGSA